MSVTKEGSASIPFTRIVRRLQIGGWLLLMSSLHVLMDINFAGGLVRVGLADAILPFLILPLVIKLWRHPDAVLGHVDRTLLLLLAATTIWLLVCVVNGRLSMGQWQSWALLNKTLGWFVLLAYLAGGFLCVRLLGIRAEHLLQTFVVSGWLIGWYFMLAYVPFWLGLSYDVDHVRLKGLFANPNAYGYAMAVAVALQIPFMQRRAWFNPWLHAFGLAVLLINVFLSGSRSALLGLLFALPLLFVLREINRAMVARVLLMAGLIGLVCFAAPHALLEVGKASAGMAMTNDLPERSVYLLDDDVTLRSGIEVRLELNLRALELWWSRPIMGIGLGTFFWDQHLSHPDHPLLIHNSALWILTEMGLIGLGLFTALLVVFWQRLWRAARQDSAQALYPGLLAVLLVVMGVSVGTEAIYQRHLWLLLGLGMALLGHAQTILDVRREATEATA